MTKRAAVAFFYDEHGILDDYMLYLLHSMKPFVEHTVLVSNGPLTKESEIAVSSIVDELIIRENEGFDVWAYKTGIEHIGYDNLKLYDELILYNHTFYGPIFPFSEMFDKMQMLPVDFWGISMHGRMEPNPFTRKGVLPAHINSHFIAIRKPMLISKAFQSYWDNMDSIVSYEDSILKHESKFTEHFSNLGYNFNSYVKLEDYGSPYPVFMDVAETIANRSPILKRRALFHNSLFLDRYAIDLPRALKLIAEHSDYDFGLIWSNILRTSKLRELNTNTALLRVLPEYSNVQFPMDIRVAVCAHIYYVDMLPEILLNTNNIPKDYDFICTTDSIDKKNCIEKILLQCSQIKNIEVRVVEKNRGRDMSALFITFRDIFLNDKYDLVCRVHTKKSPQVGQSASLLFKRHLMENLLYSKGYISEIFSMFDKNPSIGLAFPPAIHIFYATLGHGWWTNKPIVKKVMQMLRINVPLDDCTPVAPYGTMFWFKPKALEKLFKHEWAWEDFNEEPNHVDGGLAHALERSISYVAADAKFLSMHIMNPELAAFNYCMAEYKLQNLLALAPLGNITDVDHSMRAWHAAGHPAAALGIKQSSRNLINAIKRSIRARTPWLFFVLQPFYRTIRFAIKGRTPK